jgi:hypothetical protein
MRTFFLARAVFTRFETILVLAILVLLGFYAPETHRIPGLAAQACQIKWVVWLPVFLMVWCLRSGSQFTFSARDLGSALTLWPDYKELKELILGSQIFSMLFCAASIYAWLAHGGIKAGAGPMVFLLSLCGSVIVAVRLLLARHAVDELFSEDYQ